MQKKRKRKKRKIKSSFNTYKIEEEKFPLWFKILLWISIVLAFFVAITITYSGYDYYPGRGII
jgi:cell division protein FtsL